MDEVLQEMADAKGIPYNGATKQDSTEPVVDRAVNGDYLFTWETENHEYIRIQLADPLISPGSFIGYVTVQYKQHAEAKIKTLLSKRRWDMYSNSSTANMFRELNRWKGIEADWPARLTSVSAYMGENFEVGDPFVWLDEVEDPGPLDYMVEPLLQRNQHTLIGASGGSLKSMTALALCLSLASQREIIPGLKPRTATPVRSVYLDYETNAGTHRRRLLGLAQAKGVQVPPGMIGYKRMNTPLVQSKSELQRLIAMHKAELVVIDSVGRATGGETVGEEAVQSYYNATSSFGTSILSIGHSSKGSAETVAGNAQWEYQARSMWMFEATKEHGSNQVIVGMHHRKVNEGELQPSLVYVASFGREGQVAYAKGNAEDKATMSGLDLKTAISIFLEENPNSITREISAGVGKSPVRVGGVLKQWEGIRWKSDHGKPAKWMTVRRVDDDPKVIRPQWPKGAQDDSDEIPTF